MKDIQGLKNLIEQSRSRLGKIAGFSVIVIPLLDTHTTRSYNYDLLSADAVELGMVLCQQGHDLVMIM